MAHTPGPWEIQTVCHGDEVVGYNVNAKSHDPAHNGEFPYFCIESQADAQLIAAAPDLYAALKSVVDWFTALERETHERTVLNQTLETAAENWEKPSEVDMFDMAPLKAAIAKADGR